MLKHKTNYMRLCGTLARNSLFLGASIGVLALGACSTIEEAKKPKEYATFTPPPAPVPVTLPSGGTYAKLPDVAQIGLKWDELIKDEKLQKVIATGLDNNRDIRASLANIEMARNQYLAQKSNQGLNVTTGGSISNRSLADNNGTSYAANAGFSSYEIDLFGRVKSLTNVQYENYIATKYDLQTTRISLIAEIAAAYITLAQDVETLTLAKQTEASNLTTLKLTEAKFKAGLTSRIDVRQAETTLATTRNEIASTLTAIEIDKNTLSLLIGARFDDKLTPISLEALAKTFGKVPVGVSSEILLGRPDIIAAEHDLLGASANIDAARAAMFPRISLSTGIGLASDALKSLISSDAFALTNAISISQSIYGGANEYNLAYSKAQRDLYIARYEKAIQTPFNEIADALASYATIDARLKARQDLVKSSSETLRLSQAQYKAGLSSFLGVLDAQRTVYNARKSEIATRAEILSNQIDLYRAIGNDYNRDDTKD